MKVKTIALLVLATSILVLSPLVTQAQTCEKCHEQKGVISVTGIASDTFSPDTATVVLSVKTKAKTASKAASENRDKANDVIARLKGLINKENKDSIKTTSYTINPDYIYNETLKKSVLDGYTVTNEITVRTKKINDIGSLIDAALTSGANNVQSINFSIENNQVVCDNLLSQAAKRANEQASVIAKSLGVEIKGIQRVSASCDSGNRYYPRPVFATAAKADMAEGASTPIEAGDIKMQGNVSVDFFISE